MSSILKKLSDDDRAALNHMIRRDDSSDAAIWSWATERLPKSVRNPKSAIPNPSAGAMVVKRYRDSAEFQRWLARIENEGLEIRKIEARFKLLSNLVSDPDSKGMERLSKSLQARLVTLAAEASDEELREGSGDKGWIKNVIRVIQQQATADAKTQGEKIKQAIIEADAQPDDDGHRARKLVDEVDKIMGLKK